MWSDNETINDLIGFNVHKDLIKSVVTSPELLPVTMGVFGDWGSGKTSIMKMLENDLNIGHNNDFGEGANSENVLCIYFNGWMFEGYDDAKAAILDEVLRQIKDHKKFGDKVHDRIQSLMKSVDWMRMAHVGVKDIGVPIISALLTGGLSAIPQLISEKKEDGFENPINIKGLIKNQEEVHIDVRTFRTRFEEMLQETGISSLVVLIDDLDRCSPDRIIDNLEAIKLFLNVDNTAFVIGADPRIVKHAIEQRYNPLESKRFDEDTTVDDSLINDYLEKLIQVPYHLPRMSPSEVETYITLLFCKRDITDEKIFDKILDACKKQQSSNRYATFGYSSVMEVCTPDELPENLIQSLISNSKISPLITDGLKGNPRQIKRFLNAYTLRKKLAQVAHLNNIEDDILVKLMVLEYTNKDLFQQLFTWQAESEGEPEQIKALENALLTKDTEDESINFEEIAGTRGIKWSNTFVKKWITMDPHLSDVDLRDYFWIARDKLSSSFTGLTMVSPLVRTILDGLISENRGKKNQMLKRLKELNQEETEALMNLLSSHVIKNPKDINGYQAIVSLIDEDVEGSLQTLIDTVYKCPPKIIPPAIAQSFLSLVKSKPHLKTKMDPMISWLKNENEDEPVFRVLERWE